MTYKQCVFIITVGYLLTLANALYAIPVFPGAEGFGTETPAGRGGQIIKVTNLNRSGAGSFKAALEASGPRIVVFEVGGVIDIPERINLRNDKITIAGQTAPSPGITIIGATLQIYADDVLMQHIRIRPGDRQEGPDPWSRSCVRIWSGAGNVVIDHCSFSWGVDENVTIYFHSIENVTVSNSITAECLDQSIHPEGGHSKGMIVGYHSQKVTIKRNFFAHNGDRNPLIKGGCPTILLNNFMYNPIGVAINLSEASQISGSEKANVSVIGNVLRAGPGTYLSPGGCFILSQINKGTSRIYLDDNQTDGRFGLNSQDSYDPGVRVTTPEEACWTTPMTILPSSQVIDHVLANCGARPQDRDEIDTRLVNDAMNKTGRMINSQNEVGGFPDHPKTQRALTVPSDPNGDSDGDGYTNVEEWLHGMAAELEQPVVSVTSKFKNQRPKKLGAVWAGHNSIQIQLPEQVQSMDITIYAPHGACVGQYNTIRHNSIVLTKEKLRSGLYLIKAVDDNGKETYINNFISL